MANTVYKGEYGKPAASNRKQKHQQAMALKAAKRKRTKKV
jgi:hypothetical protein